MKINLLFLILAFPFFAESQERKRDTMESLTLNNKSNDIAKNTLTSFWGIPFGSKVEEAITIKPKTKKEDSKTASCLDSSYGKHTGDILLKFNQDGKLSGGIVILKPTDNELSFELYDEVIESLQSKYGKPFTSEEEFESLYQDGRGRKHPTLSIPTSSVRTIWEFQSASNSESKAFISVGITREFKIMILYMDYYFGKDELDSKRRKEMSDY